MNIEFGADTYDSALQELQTKFGKNDKDLILYVLKNNTRKRDLIELVLNSGKYLNDTPVIDEKATEDINELVKKGIIPVAVAEPILNRIDRIIDKRKKEKQSPEITEDVAK